MATAKNKKAALREKMIVKRIGNAKNLVLMNYLTEDLTPQTRKMLVERIAVIWKQKPTKKSMYLLRYWWAIVPYHSELKRLITEEIIELIEKISPRRIPPWFLRNLEQTVFSAPIRRSLIKKAKELKIPLN